MLLYYGLLCYWLLTIGIAVVSHFVPLLAAASAYGKLTTPQRANENVSFRSSTASPLHSSVSALILSPRLYLSNGRCFTFYYSLATLLNALLLRSAYAWYATGQWDWLLHALVLSNRWLVWHLAPSLAFSPLDSHWPPHTSAPVALLQLHAAYQLHFMRRLWECWRVHRFSAQSRQHVLVTLFGALFYVALILSPTLDQLQRTHTQGAKATSVLAASGALAAVLFVAGSVWQHRCHVTLADLRAAASPHSAGAAATYSVPRGGGFSFLLCPHYTAELLIYLSFAVLRPCLLQWLALVWTAVNLTATASKTRRWYASKWPHGEWTRRWNIVPFLV